jgi:hypothetical protein
MTFHTRIYCIHIYVADFFMRKYFVSCLTCSTHPFALTPWPSFGQQKKLNINVTMLAAEKEEKLAAAFLKRKLLNHEVTLLYIWYKAGEERRAGESWSCSVVARVVAPLCERKNTLRGNKLSRKLSELVSGKLGVFGDLGL